MDEITNRFLELFNEISQIPRESGKEKKFADFLELFAKKNNLECYRDENNNVLIKKLRQFFHKIPWKLMEKNI